MHNEIVAAVESVLPVAKVLSVDEMVCRLMGDHLQLDRAIEVGWRIKRAIRDRAGEWMRCSVGIAPNRLLAKVAADMQKPDGLTVIRREDLPDRLADLKLTDFPGIGPRMEERLNLAGVTTARQFIVLTAGELSRHLGKPAHGRDVVSPASRRGRPRLADPAAGRSAIRGCWDRIRGTSATPAPSWSA